MANFCKKCGKKISGGDYCSDHSSSDASGSISNVSQNQQLDSSSGHYQPIGVLPSNGGFADRLSAAHVPFGNQTQSAFHPWRRYFARYLDNYIYFGVSLVLLYRFPTIDSALAAIIFFGGWIFIEPIFLSTWGTTIGKKIFGIKVRNKLGDKLSYSEALKRSFVVWFRGLGFGIPIVALFTLIAAYNRLKDKSITSWDEGGGFVVTYR